jgi:hypothetical protein
LWDALQATDLLREFSAGKSFGDYQADAMLRSAVERQFEIIGEALNQLSKLGLGARVSDSGTTSHRGIPQYSDSRICHGR